MRLSDIQEGALIKKEGHMQETTARRRGNVLVCKKTYKFNEGPKVYFSGLRICDPARANFVVAVESGEIFAVRMTRGCIASAESIFHAIGFSRVYCTWMPKNFTQWSRTWTKKIVNYS